MESCWVPNSEFLLTHEAWLCRLCSIQCSIIYEKAIQLHTGQKSLIPMIFMTDESNISVLTKSEKGFKVGIPWQIFILAPYTHSLSISTHPHPVVCQGKLTSFSYKTKFSCPLSSCWHLVSEGPGDGKVGRE